jgi:nucleoside-diphosphate-sugar epimerase
VDDPQTRRPDITQAREKLGWEPKVTLAEGLRSTIAYFRSMLDRQGVLPDVPPNALPDKTRV